MRMMGNYRQVLAMVHYISWPGFQHRYPKLVKIGQLMEWRHILVDALP